MLNLSQNGRSRRATCTRGFAPTDGIKFDDVVADELAGTGLATRGLVTGEAATGLATRGAIGGDGLAPAIGEEAAGFMMVGGCALCAPSLWMATRWGLCSDATGFAVVAVVVLLADSCNVFGCSWGAECGSWAVWGGDGLEPAIGEEAAGFKMVGGCAIFAPSLWMATRCGLCSGAAGCDVVAVMVLLADSCDVFGCSWGTESGIWALWPIEACFPAIVPICSMLCLLSSAIIACNLPSAARFPVDQEQ